ncbi:hypothetical protein PF003_g35047 [Phytophthora fragariae]|nr:hypothetical protein PF003_g35047 [Phytophthora fragariae]
MQSFVLVVRATDATLETTTRTKWHKPTRQATTHEQHERRVVLQDAMKYDEGEVNRHPTRRPDRRRRQARS